MNTPPIELVNKPGCKIFWFRDHRQLEVITSGSIQYIPFEWIKAPNNDELKAILADRIGMMNRQISTFVEALRNI
jgi:hypothetical protein